MFCNSNFKIKLILFLCIIILINNKGTFNKKNFLKNTNPTKLNPRRICIDEKFNLNTNYRDEQNNIACGSYYDEEGWHIFDVATFARLSNIDRVYFAGYIEGLMFENYINYHYTNIYLSIFNNHTLSEKTFEFVFSQFNYSQNYSKNQKNVSEYEETLLLILEQYKGLYDGYKSGHSLFNSKQELINEKDFYLITMQADLEDIVPAFEPHRFSYKENTKERECSGFVKYVKETNDLIVGHTTHNMYTLMNRIYKSYNLNIILESTGKKLNNYKYTSRPGDLNSKDDYYLLDNKMIVLETSLEIENLDIYKNLNSNTIPKWIRVNIANQLANNNQEWIEIFFRENSGTHNDQWLLIDYNAFDKYLQNMKFLQYLGEENTSPEGIVHIVEQTPRLDKKYFEDLSKKLIDETYVASYNAPYFDEVIEDLGYNVEPFSNKTYLTANRYFIFKKLHSGVKTIEDAKSVMRYHDLDEICDTIAPRCDKIQNRPFGGVDSKLINKNLIDSPTMRTKIIYGPSHIEGVTEPFNFKAYPTWSHLGIPEIFNFTWIEA